MDKTDIKLLNLLMENSRIPITKLSKQARISREVATYRLNKLKKEGVILDFVTEIDTDRLGYIGAAIFINIKSTRQNEFIDFIRTTGFVSWVAELSGIWNFGFSVYGKDNNELDQNFRIIFNKFRKDIIDHRFTLHKKSTFFYEKYFGVTPKQDKTKKIKDYKLDTKDRIILKEISNNSRIESTKLATKISLTAPAIISRIKHLESSKHIKKYSIFIDLKKFGLFQYSVFVVNKNIDEKEKLLAYLSEHNNISFIAEYVGDEFLEFGLFVKNPYELREKILEIEESFPDNRVMEISLFQKEFVSVGPPDIVFQ